MLTFVVGQAGVSCGLFTFGTRKQKNGSTNRSSTPVVIRSVRCLVWKIDSSRSMCEHGTKPAGTDSVDWPFSGFPDFEHHDSRVTSFDSTSTGESEDISPARSAAPLPIMTAAVA